MAKPSLANRYQEFVDQAVALDKRRREQIANQRESINRLLERISLLENGLPVNGTGDKEIIMGKRRDAFLAGFEAGTQPKAKRPDPEKAFDAWKAEEDGDINATDPDTDDE